MKYEDPKPELIYSKFVDFKTIVKITFRNDNELTGIIQSFSPGSGKIGEIKIWHFIELKNRDEYEQTKSKTLIRDIPHSHIKIIESMN